MHALPLDRRAHPDGARTSFWTAADGWLIRRFDWWQAEQSHAEGSIFFASGRGDFVEKYLEAFGHWHAKGFNITSFDWRGQGHSRGDIESGHVESFDGLVEDGAALIAEWLRSTPAPHFLVGHSMGGHLLLRIIAEHRPAVEGAVFIAPMININSTPLPSWLARLVARACVTLGWSRRRAWRHDGKPFAAGSRRQINLTASIDRYADEIWWKKKEPGFHLGPPTWGWFAAAYASIAKLPPAVLASIDIPVLFITARKDRLVSARAIRKAARLVQGAEILILDKCGHEILRERDDLRTVALARIDAFFERHRR